MFDVLVVGGGPAGAVAGMCAARAGARVAIVEATGYDADRFGETLPPEINPVLRELGLWEPFRELAPVEAPGIVSSWGTESAVEQDFVASPHGSGWRVDRNTFDAMLLHQAERAGARVLKHRRAGVPRRALDVWSMDEIRARFVIDAAGKNGMKLEARALREMDDVLLAIALVLNYDGGAPADCRTYLETSPAGWWYSGLLPGGNLMAMFFTDPETYNGQGVVIADQLGGAPLTRERLRRGRIQRSRVVYAPSCRRLTIFGDGWAAVGDSASCYDPLSGQGILKALRQGAAAAGAVVRALDGEQADLAKYAATVRQEFESYARQRRNYYAMEGRWKASAFWERRLA